MRLTKRARRIKVRLFVQHYVGGSPSVRGDATKAAIAAGYAPRSAHVQGSRILKDPSVQVEIEKRLAKHEITADRVLGEIAKIAFMDPREFVSWTRHGVTLTPSSRLEDAAPIAEVSEHVNDSGRAVRIRFHDKTANLALLAKYLKLTGDNPGDAAPAEFTLNIGEIGEGAKVQVNVLPPGTNGRANGHVVSSPPPNGKELHDGRTQGDGPDAAA